jgi:hypothetical protein
MSKMFVIVVLSATVAGGGGLAHRVERGQAAASEQPAPPPLPIVKRPADEASVMLATYTFAAEHPEILRYIPCFCVCGKQDGHRSNEDCFIAARGKKNTVVWNAHAAECPICLSVARDARAMYLEGRDLASIRAEIERVYGAKFPNRTQTPEPPTAP